MEIDLPRLLSDLETLAGFGATAEDGVSRTSFSDADLAARRWLRDRCEEAGLEVRTDGAGNIRARLPGPNGAAVWTGSHLDSVPNGGRYDGALGVLTSLECLRRLREEAAELVRPVELVVLADEEGNYHHLFGSHALVEGFDRATLARLTGRDGDRLQDALARIGSNLDAAAAAKVDPATIHAFVELHIEQGPLLESTGTDIGVVTSIVGLGGGSLRFEGRADHAGTTPMASRRDALRAGAAFLMRLPDLTAKVSEHAVVTCGRIAVHPSADNVVPGEAVLQLDFRDPGPDGLEVLEGAIIDHATSCASAHDVTATFTRNSLTAPVALDPDIMSLIEQAADAGACASRRMPSGAAHDSQHMATIAATGMIFVPSVGGRSHSPAEYTEPTHIHAGANVLLETLRRLANRR